MAIPPISTSLPEAVSGPADALAFIAARKGLDVQKSQAAALIALLDVNAGTRLNVSAQVRGARRAGPGNRCRYLSESTNTCGGSRSLLSYE